MLHTAGAADWTRDQLAQIGRTITGEIEPRDSSTSWILRVPTDSGAVYFKTSLMPYETALTQQFAAWVPHHAPAILAADAARNWLLTDDLGLTLRKQTEADGDLTRWDDVLRQYAHIQRETSPHADNLLALGIPDRRLHQLVGQFTALVAQLEPAVDQKDGIPAAEYQAMLGFAPQVAHLCESLAQLGLPATLHHDDFHANNVAMRGGDPVFFDWAECALAHPFFSAMLMIRYAKFIFNATDAQQNHLRDVYLSAWAGEFSLSALHSGFEIAQRLAALSRALTWGDLIPKVEDRYRADCLEASAYWLRLFTLGREPEE